MMSPQGLKTGLAGLMSPLWLAVLCYVVWGFVPLAYLPLQAAGAGPLEIMAHRSVWAVVFALILVIALKQGPELISVLGAGKMRWVLLCTALLVGINWGLFIWTVENHALLESSLGYYINPLINMAAGAWLFQERLDRWGQAAIGLAVIGVGVQTVALGHLPLMSLAIAISFASYGIIRKQLNISALSGLLIECLYLSVPSLAFILWGETHHQGHFMAAPATVLWFILTGPITVAPLALFAYVARRLSLSTMGFVQFLSPSIAFCIGLFEGETFSPLRAGSFALIWLGALVFAVGAWRRVRRLQSAMA